MCGVIAMSRVFRLVLLVGGFFIFSTSYADVCQNSEEGILLESLQSPNLVVLEYGMSTFSRRFDCNRESVEDWDVVEQVFVRVLNFLKNPEYKSAHPTPTEIRVRKKAFQFLRKLHPAVRELYSVELRVSKIDTKELVSLAQTENDPENVLEFWPYLEEDAQAEFLFQWSQKPEKEKEFLEAASRRIEHPKFENLVNMWILRSKTHIDIQKRIVAIQTLGRWLQTYPELMAPFFQTFLDLLVHHIGLPRKKEIQETALSEAEKILNAFHAGLDVKVFVFFIKNDPYFFHRMKNFVKALILHKGLDRIKPDLFKTLLTLAGPLTEGAIEQERFVLPFYDEPLPCGRLLTIHN